MVTKAGYSIRKHPTLRSRIDRIGDAISDGNTDKAWDRYLEAREHAIRSEKLRRAKRKPKKRGK